MDKSHKWILLATILASGMSFLDGTVVGIAAPAIQSYFHTDIIGIQWLTDAFALALASLILVSGSLGDHFGVKKIFSIGIVIFTLASALCSFSQTINQLIIFRVIQGIGSAMMIPGSLAIINNSFPENKRGRAIGLWSGFSGGVAALGPFVGGALVQYFNWQSIFFINLPIGLLALFVTWKYVADTKFNESKKLDYLGTLFITLGLFGLSFGIIEGPAWGWQNNWILTSLVGGIAALVIFVLYERSIKNPLFPFEIFKSGLVTGANLMTFFLYFALYGMFFFLILNFRQAQGYDYLFSGLGMLPFILLVTFGSGYGGTLADKIGPRLPMIIGPSIVGVGFLLLSFVGLNANYFYKFLPALVLVGIGMAIAIAPLTKSALSVSDKYYGSASGVNNAVSRIAALLAVAILGAVFLVNFRSELSANIANSSLNQSERSNILNQTDKMGAIETTDSQGKMMVLESFSSSYQVTMKICAALAFLSAFISFLTIKPKNSKA